jgi:hypothetical protein
VDWLWVRGHAEGKLENPSRCETVRVFDFFYKSSIPLSRVLSSSNGPQYPCPEPECNRRFSDAAARIRHRKRTHGYVPYHTREYLARQTLNRKERIVEGASKAVSNKNRRQCATSPALDGLPSASLSAPLPPNVPEVAYHDDHWKELVNFAQSYAPESQHSHDVPLTLPFASIPGHDTPIAIQPFSMQQEAHPSLTPSDFNTIDYSDFLATIPGYDAIQPSSMAPEEQLQPSPTPSDFTFDYSDLATMPGYDAIQLFSIQPEEQLQPSITPLDITIDYSDLLGPQIDASTLSQGQAFRELFTADHCMPPYNASYDGLWN